MSKNLFGKINEDFLRDNVVDIKSHSWRRIIFNYICYVLLILFIVFVIYANGFLNFIQSYSDNIIQLTLIMSLLVLFGIVVYILVIKVGGLKFREVGLKREMIIPGILFYVSLYIIVNIVLLISNLITSGTPNYYPYWAETGIPYAIGAIIAQIFGNVLAEETFFRGYLFTQITKKFYKEDSSKKFPALFKGIIVTNAIFAVMHIPINLLYGMGGINLVLNLLILFGIGAFFNIIYVLTGNLFMTMAVHVIGNIAFALFYPIIDTQLIGYIAAIGLCVIIIYWKRKK